MKLDEPLCFYMRHRTQLEEWIALRKRLVKEIDRLLISVGQLIEERRRDLPGEPQLLRASRDPHRKIFLYLSEWTSGHIGAAGGRSSWANLRAGIGMEWPEKDCWFDEPYLCAWQNRDHPQFDEVNAALWEPVRDHGVTLGSERPKNWYPASKYIALPDDEFWTDLDALREHYAAQIIRWSEEFFPIVSLHFPA